MYGPNTFYGMSLALLKLNSGSPPSLFFLFLSFSYAADILASIDMEGIHSTLKENPSKGLSYEKILKTALSKKFRLKQKKIDKLLAKKDSL